MYFNGLNLSVHHFFECITELCDTILYLWLVTETYRQPGTVLTTSCWWCAVNMETIIIDFTVENVENICAGELEINNLLFKSICKLQDIFK
jgi:hypothetical protein